MEGESNNGNAGRELREILKEHQDQQLNFLNSMEEIRWKFVAAFGVGAGVTIFFAVASGEAKIPPDQVSAAGWILALISLASVAVQIRIYGLVHSSWTRIRALQKEEATLVAEIFGERHRVSPVLSHLFEFPHVTFKEGVWRGLSHFGTVHMATCTVFCAFIYIGLLLAKPSYGALWVTLAICCWVICLAVSWWYTSHLNRDLKLPDRASDGE